MNTTVSTLPIHSQQTNVPRFSFEFFPPKNPRMERTLWRTIGQLERFNPAFFSMTYGALGSERHYSLDAVATMQSECNTPVAAHLTAAGHTRDSLLELAQDFHDKGVKSIVALRGDADLLPDGLQDVAVMIEHLRSVADFDISVAAYPEVHPKAANLQADLAHLKHKLDAGANRALSQYFFDVDNFLRFRDAASSIGITQPLVPGILPIHNFARVQGFSERCGAKIPAFLHAYFAGTEDGSAEQRQLGVELAADMVRRLQAEGVQQFHFYTLNLPNLTFDIIKQLGMATVVPSLAKAA